MDKSVSSMWQVKAGEDMRVLAVLFGLVIAMMCCPSMKVAAEETQYAAFQRVVLSHWNPPPNSPKLAGGITIDRSGGVASVAFRGAEDPISMAARQSLVAAFAQSVPFTMYMNDVDMTGTVSVGFEFDPAAVARSSSASPVEGSAPYATGRKVTKKKIVAADAPETNQVANPSFDCTKAKTASARLICSDGELAQLDGQLGGAFQQVRSNLDGADREDFVREQLDWIRERNKNCGLVGKDNAPIDELASSKTCMEDAIRKRLVDLVGEEPESSAASANGKKSRSAAHDNDLAWKMQSSGLIGLWDRSGCNKSGPSASVVFVSDKTHGAVMSFNDGPFGTVSKISEFQLSNPSVAKFKLEKQMGNGSDELSNGIMTIRWNDQQLQIIDLKGNTGKVLIENGRFAQNNTEAPPFVKCSDELFAKAVNMIKSAFARQSQNAQVMTQRSRDGAAQAAAVPEDEFKNINIAVNLQCSQPAFCADGSANPSCGPWVIQIQVILKTFQDNRIFTDGNKTRRFLDQIKNDSRATCIKALSEGRGYFTELHPETSVRVDGVNIGSRDAMFIAFSEREETPWKILTNEIPQALALAEAQMRAAEQARQDAQAAQERAQQAKLDLRARVWKDLGISAVCKSE